MPNNVLIADDDAVSRRLLEATLQGWGYEVRVATDGKAAWEMLSEPAAPRLAILDWMMPDLDGLQICRQLRRQPEGGRIYILLLTAKMQKEDIVVGLESGADDYVTKPFHLDELKARVAVGQRILELQDSLADRVRELEKALAEVKQLRGLLPICSYCKRIREGDEYSKSVEAYLAEHSEAKFSHGVCRDCYEKHVKPQLEKL